MKCIKERILVIAVFAFMVLIGLKFCNDKDGYHVDEIYTCILSNSEYAPWIMDIKEGDITSKIITRQELIDLITIDETDEFEYGSVYYNQTKDVHPPLYYYLIHTLSSIFTNSFSKWIGLGLNVIVYLVTIALLYHLINKFWCDSQNALLVTVIYGLSNIALSTLLFIRMYMLLTFFTLLLAYLILEHMKSPREILYPAIFVTMFLGMLTQYYFVIYAFFVCAGYDFFLLLKRKYKSFAGFSIAALSGLTAMLIYFPHFATQLSVQKNVSIDKTVRNAQNMNKWLPRFFTMSKEVGSDVKTGIIIVLILFALFIVSIIRKTKTINKIRLDEKLLVILPAYIAYIVVCIIAPYVTVRYVYHLIPIMLLLISYIYDFVVDKSVKKILYYGTLCLTIAISVLFLRRAKPDYVFNHSEINTFVEENQEYPCIFVTENEPAPITSSIPQLLYFDECLVTDESGIQDIAEYIEKHDKREKVVVFFTIQPENIDIDLVENCLLQNGYLSNETVYENEFYRLYLFYS